MKTETIKQEVIELISELFKEKGFDIDILEYVDLIDDLGMDSITFISLIVEIEERFGMEFPDALLSLDNFRKINGIVNIVERELIDK